MTKYFLHGGFAKNGCNNEKIFFEEIVSALDDGDRILMVYFHTSWKKYLKKYSHNKKNFSDYSNGKKFEFVLAEKEKFMDQLRSVDAVFIRGGNTVELIDFFKKCSGFFDEITKKKVYVGVSAGAYAVSRFFYTNLKDFVDEGMGVLPIKTRCHYIAEDDQKIKEKFDEFSESAECELVLLKDCEFRVFES